ncbi:MAG: FAD-dependent oxidoreductase [Bacteroidota bacterium]
MIDYLVVGSGLAGIAFCRILQENNRSFLLYDDGVQQSSTVAAGIYNPVVLKRFKAVWNAAAQLDVALPFYETFQRDFSVQLHHQLPIYRKFSSVEEQNLWFEASDKSALQPFLSTTLVENKNPGIIAPFYLGKVLHTGRIDVALLQSTFREYLQQQKRLVKERLHYELLEVSPTAIKYKQHSARHLVCCEGFGLHQNSLFKYLPLQGAKGELITIKAPELKLHTIIKSSLFIIPVGHHTYKVGATYAWHDKTQRTTPEARQELITRLRTLLNCPFEVIGQQAGIRPTVIDRRPLVGTHPTLTNVHILNGLGSRGVLMAPFAARQLYQHIETATPLATAIDIKRFEDKYIEPKKQMIV